MSLLGAAEPRLFAERGLTKRPAPLCLDMARRPLIRAHCAYYGLSTRLSPIPGALMVISFPRPLTSTARLWSLPCAASQLTLLLALLVCVVRHFLDAMTPAYKDIALNQLLDVVNLLARGQAPAAVAPYLAGAGLVAVPKPKGGVRPIAIGEVLRRITGKALCATAENDAAACFAPLQVGVACPLGVDAAVHASRAWARRDSNNRHKCLVKLDFENAFNNVDREHLLRKCREAFPGLAKWAHWCYRAQTNLQFGEHTLASAAGFQQGDPLGPLFFAVAVQDLVADLARLPGDGPQLDLGVFYLDDGVLAGDVEAVSAAFQMMQSRGLQLGLKLKVSKCELVLTGDAADVELSTFFPRELLVDAETNESRVLTGGNFELLGAAIGDAAFCEEYTEGKVAKASRLLDCLSSLEDPQVSLRLMQKCAGVCKVTHSMRMTPPGLHTSALRHFDDSVQAAFSQATGLLPDQQQWGQACRGFSKAGLGLRSAHLHKEAAFLASAASASTLCHSIDPLFRLEGDNPASEFGTALTAFNANLPADQHVTASQVASMKQKELSIKLDAAGHSARLASVTSSDRATLISECEDGAKDFWTVVPSTVKGLAVPAAEFVAEIKYRLCMDQGTGDWCPLCDSVLDIRGHHCRCCIAGGDKTVRHNKARNAMFSFCVQEAGIQAELERPGLLLPIRPHEPGNARRPADVYLPLWYGGLPAALDFAVTSPNQAAYVGTAANVALHAAISYSETKRAHLNTATACAAQGVTFLPMVCETSGAWAPEASAVLKQVARQAAARVGRPASEFYRSFLQRLAVAVRTANARAHLKRMG